MRMKYACPCLVLVLAAAPALAEPAAEVVSGVEYQEGDYFTGEQVELLTAQTALRVRAGRATFAVSVPWHRLEAPGNVVGGGGLLGLPIIVDPERPGARSVRQGLGDVRVGAAYALPPVGGVQFGLNGQVKLPTASAERGLGTGEADFSVGVEAARDFGRVTPYVAVGYTLPGDPAGYDLRNSLSVRGGVGVQIASGLRGSIGYGYAESISPLVPSESLLSTGLNASLSRNLSLGLYGSAGMSDGAADFGAGLSVGVKLF